MNHRPTMYQILAVLAGCVAAYMIIQAAVSARQQSVVVVLQDEIQKTEATLQTIAATTARLGADPVADSIISNCPSNDLASYNQLLGRLNEGLSTPELTRLDRDFGRCGYRNFQRRSILVLQFESKMQLMQQHMALLELTGTRSDVVERLSAWEELLVAEQSLTLQFRRLTELQDQIIQALLLGSSIGSSEIEEILLEVKQTRDAMAVRHLQLESLREQLLPS